MNTHYNKLNNVFVLFVGLLLISNSIFGQDKVSASQSLPNMVMIKGIVVDENKESLSYATVYAAMLHLPNKPFRSVACKEDGTFELMLPQNSKFILNIQFLGYRTISKLIVVTTETVDMGVIEMEVSDVQMKEIVIKPLIEIDSRQIVYNITSDPDRATSSMTDMLRKVPLIEVGPDGGISINGDKQGSSYIILRNGRKDALLNDKTVSYSEIMKRLPAMGFTKITLMLDPPPLYRDYDYVISVEADKTMSLVGAIGESRDRYNWENKTLELNLGVIGSADKLRFSASAGYSNENSPDSFSDLIRESYSVVGNSEEKVSQANQSNRKGDVYKAVLNISQDLGKKHFLNVNFSYSYTDASLFNNTVFKIEKSDQWVLDQKENTILSKNNHSYKGDLNYQLDFDKSGRNLILSYNFIAISDNEESVLEREGDDIIVAAERKPSLVEQTDHLFSINYLDKFSKFDFNHRISYLSSDASQQSNVYERRVPFGEETENKGYFSGLDRYIRRLDGYTTLTWQPTRNLSANAAVRWDYMLNGSKVEFRNGIDPMQVVDQSGIVFSPQFKLEALFPKKIKKAHVSRDSPPMSPGATIRRLMFSYLMDQRRPSYYQLTNYKNDTDPNNIVMGNPTLNNEIYHIFSLSFMHPVLYPNISYTFSNNRIDRAWHLNSLGQTVQTYENTSDFESVELGLMKNIRLKQGNHVTFFVRGSYSKSHIESHLKESYILSGNVNYFTLLFNKALYMSVNMSYLNYWDNGYSGFKKNIPVSLSLNLQRTRNFKNSLRLEYGVLFSDLLDWNGRSETFVNSDTFSQRLMVKQQKIPVVFRVKVTFGSFKVKPVRRPKKVVDIEGFSTGEIPSVNEIQYNRVE